jgi:uncharacterized protein (TIGR02147 family)
MMTATLDISQYTEYSKYLHDAYVARRLKDKKFSQRFINQKMGSQSSGWFADVLAGRKKLKLRHAAPMAAIFKLDAREQEFLRILIAMELADSHEEKTIAYDKWLELKGVSQEKISRDRFKYFERWYYPALRELLIIYPFRGDYAGLGARLHPPISARQAKEGVTLLTRLGLINSGAPAPLPVLLMDTSARTKYWDGIMKAYMQLSLPALEKFRKEERDFSALTLPLSQEGLQKAGEEIAALRKRLLALSERDKANDRIYQCLFQVFPISRSMEAPRV